MTTAPTCPCPLLLTPAEAGAALGMTMDQLRVLRDTNSGPEFYRIGRRLIRYNTADLHRWKSCTAQPAQHDEPALGERHTGCVCLKRSHLPNELQHWPSSAMPEV